MVLAAVVLVPGLSHGSGLGGAPRLPLCDSWHFLWAMTDWGAVGRGTSQMGLSLCPLEGWGRVRSTPNV